MPQIIKDLNLLLAENYALYLKTQCYHWNITGHNFYQFHLLFEKQYNDLGQANDAIAERIRALDAKVPASFSLFNAAKTATDPQADSNSTTMLGDLMKDHQHLADLLLKLAGSAAASNDKATEDLMIERLREHEKQIWILKSSL